MSIDIEPDRAREVLLALKQRRGEYATNRQLLGDAGGALDAIEELEAIDFALASMAELKALRERVEALPRYCGDGYKDFDGPYLWRSDVLAALEHKS